MWTWERRQWRGTPHSPKLQYYRSLTIRLFSVIYRTLVRWESYLSAEKQSDYYTAAADWARVRVDLETIAMKRYSTLLKAPELELAIKHFCAISRTLVVNGGLTLFQRGKTPMHNESAYSTHPDDWTFVDGMIQRLEEYFKKTNESLIIATSDFDTRIRVKVWRAILYQILLLTKYIIYQR